MSQTNFIDLERIKKAGQLLVTGTDTGIGKTWTTVRIIEALRAAGEDVFAVKPVETGCTVETDGGLVGADINEIAGALGLSKGDSSYKDLYFKLYQSPVAPSVAVKREGQKLEWSELVAWVSDTIKKQELLLVEGAGGLLVPIVDGKTYAELAAETDLKILVVFGSRLGAINQAALTFEVLRARGLPVLGYVFNQMTVPVQAEEGLVNADETNRELLREVAARYEVEEIGFQGWEVR